MDFKETMIEETMGNPDVLNFLSLLELDDNLFNMAYPDLIKNLDTEEFESELRNSVQRDVAEEAIPAMRELQGMLRADEELSDMKKSFVTQVFDKIISTYESIIENSRKFVYCDIELCHENAVLPTYAHKGDAGMDVYAVEDMVINGLNTVVVPTGLKIAVPFGYEIQVRPRSGMSLKTPMRVANSPGTVDFGYLDEVGIIMTNSSSKNEYTIKAGDRIAQLVIQETPMIQFKVVDSIEDKEVDRGGGFGSTDTDDAPAITKEESTPDLHIVDKDDANGPTED